LGGGVVIVATIDYGPVAVSRLRREIASVSIALDQKRRVLLSRHGQVVAAIEPPSSRFDRLLLDYTTLSRDDRTVPVLTLTQIGRGAPGPFIKDAQDGISTLITSHGRVLGVLTKKPEPLSSDGASDRLELMKEFAAKNRDASPAEFAKFGASLISEDSGQGPANSQNEWANALFSTMQGISDGVAPKFGIPFVEYKAFATEQLGRSDDGLSLLKATADIIPQVALQVVTGSPLHRASDLHEHLRRAQAALVQLERSIDSAENASK
jgi:hypothetical protein